MAHGEKGSAFVPHDLAAPVAGAASGPLAGLSFALKDMYDVAGERCSAGNPEWLDDHAPATRTAPVVQALLDAGATLVGKTVCDEFFYSLSGVNVHYGTPPNPYWPGRLPGGSSSGSASVVSAGSVDFALGSDSGGSTRVPAAFCGIWGIRTTHGRLPFDGVMPMSPSFDTVGVFAPSAGLLRAVLHVVLDADGRSSSWRRTLLPTDLVAVAEPEVAAVFDAFVDKVRPLLPPCEPVEFVEPSPAAWVECFCDVQAAEVKATYGDWIRARKPSLGPDIAERMAYALALDDATADRARSHRKTIQRNIETTLGGDSIMLVPTAPCRPPRLDATADELDRFRAAAMQLTCTAGLGGLPQVAMPIQGPDGPFSASLVGPPGTDEALLDLAATLAPWTGR